MTIEAALLDTPQYDPPEVHLRLVGEVDMATAWSLPEAITAALVRSPVVVIVATCDVTFIDVVGVSALLALRSHLREQGGELVLRCPSAAVRATLAALHLTDELIPSGLLRV